jgi:CheY-like chemotaxis protein
MMNLIIADTIADILTGGGFEATARYCGHSALEQARRSCPDAVVSDVIMPQLNGIDMAISIKKNCPRTRILLLSGQRSTADLVEAARRAGHRFELLFKPLQPDILLKKLRQ